MKNGRYLLPEYAHSKMKGNLGYLTSALETRLSEAEGVDKTIMCLPEKNCESHDYLDPMYARSLRSVTAQGAVLHKELHVFVCPAEHNENPRRYILDHVVCPIVERWVKFYNNTYSVKPITQK